TTWSRAVSRGPAPTFSRKITASPGLSSMSRRRWGTGWGVPLSVRRPGGELGEREPELVDGPDNLPEPVEVDGLGDVAVRAPVVGCQYVILGVARGEDDDGDAAEV